MPEAIPDDDDASRHLFKPNMGSRYGDLIWSNVFMFQSKQGYCESLVWRRHATIDRVHELGCQKETNDRAAGRVDRTYLGALTARVGTVRAIRSGRGARFDVVHAEEEGVHHLHVKYVNGAGLSPNDKAELKSKIKTAFEGNSAAHHCGGLAPADN